MMKAILVQNGYEKALLVKSKKPLRMFMEDFEKMDLKALSIIHLCLLIVYLERLQRRRQRRVFG